MARHDIDLPRPPPLSRTGRNFILVNLLGVPALAFVDSFLQRGGEMGGQPNFIFVVLSLALGVGVIGYNAWMTWRGKRAAGWVPAVIAMALWTAACLVTLLAFGSFSPLTLALGYIGLV